MNIHFTLETVEYVLGLGAAMSAYFLFKKSKRLILTPELIPYSMHYKNVRAVLSYSDWQTIAKMCYRDSKYHCDICKRRTKLECHEIWHFDDINLVQKLVGLTSLCSDCHRVKHIGLAKKMGWYHDSLKHMAKINGISKSRAQKYVNYAELEVKKRKGIYSLDLTYLNKYRDYLPRRYTTYENNSCQSIQGNW